MEDKKTPADIVRALKQVKEIIKEENNCGDDATDQINAGLVLMESLLSQLEDSLNQEKPRT